MKKKLELTCCGASLTSFRGGYDLKIEAFRKNKLGHFENYDIILKRLDIHQLQCFQRNSKIKVKETMEAIVQTHTEYLNG
jgi:hypothetical protein